MHYINEDGKSVLWFLEIVRAFTTKRVLMLWKTSVPFPKKQSFSFERQQLFPPIISVFALENICYFPPKSLFFFLENICYSPPKISFFEGKQQRYAKVLSADALENECAFMAR